MSDEEGRDEKGRFKIGHLWSIGNKGGRPPIYDNEEELFHKIAEYLEWEDKTSKGKYTIEGCALWLGFASRQSMQDYKGNPKFSYVMGRFYLFLSHYHAQRLTWAGSFQGAQFWLKNFGGYTDESTVNQNVNNVKADFGNSLQSPQESGEDTPGNKQPEE